jgi:hypothetical protein
VGANIVDGGRRTLDVADFVWSEQFGHKIHLIGQTDTCDEVRLVTDTPASLLVLYASQGRLSGACVIGQMPTVLKCRRWVGARAPLADVDLWRAAA